MTTLLYGLGKKFMVGRTDLKILNQALELLESTDDDAPTLSKRERVHLEMLRKLVTEIRKANGGSDLQVCA
jgi:hypothetical protein